MRVYVWYWMCMYILVMSEVWMYGCMDVCMICYVWMLVGTDGCLLACCLLRLRMTGSSHLEGHLGGERKKGFKNKKTKQTTKEKIDDDDIVRI